MSLRKKCTHKYKKSNDSFGLSGIFFHNKNLLNFKLATNETKCSNRKNPVPKSLQNSICSLRLNRIHHGVVMNMHFNQQKIQTANVLKSKRSKEEKLEIEKLDIKNSDIIQNNTSNNLTLKRSHTDLSNNISYHIEHKRHKRLHDNISDIDNNSFLRNEAFLRNPFLFESLPVSVKSVGLLTDINFRTCNSKEKESSIVDCITVESTVNHENNPLKTIPTSILYKTKSIAELLLDIDNVRLNSSNTYKENLLSETINDRIENIKRRLDCNIHKTSVLPNINLPPSTMAFNQINMLSHYISESSTICPVNKTMVSKPESNSSTEFIDPDPVFHLTNTKIIQEPITTEDTQSINYQKEAFIPASSNASFSLKSNVSSLDTVKNMDPTLQKFSSNITGDSLSFSLPLLRSPMDGNNNFHSNCNPLITDDTLRKQSIACSIANKELNNATGFDNGQGSSNTKSIVTPESRDSSSANDQTDNVTAAFAQPSNNSTILTKGLVESVFPADQRKQDLSSDNIANTSVFWDPHRSNQVEFPCPNSNYILDLSNKGNSQDKSNPSPSSLCSSLNYCSNSDNKLENNGSDSSCINKSIESPRINPNENLSALSGVPTLSSNVFCNNLSFAHTQNLFQFGQNKNEISGLDYAFNKCQDSDKISNMGGIMPNIVGDQKPEYEHDKLNSGTITTNIDGSHIFKSDYHQSIGNMFSNDFTVLGSNHERPLAENLLLEHDNNNEMPNKSSSIFGTELPMSQSPFKFSLNTNNDNNDTKPVISNLEADQCLEHLEPPSGDQKESKVKQTFITRRKFKDNNAGQSFSITVDNKTDSNDTSSMDDVYAFDKDNDNMQTTDRKARVILKRKKTYL